MKLSHIVRAIVRPLVHVHSVDAWFILSRGEDHWSSASVGIFCNPRDIPSRATRRAIIGDLTIAWWAPGPDERMAIRFSKPLTPESATEIAQALEGLRVERREERGAS